MVPIWVTSAGLTLIGIIGYCPQFGMLQPNTLANACTQKGRAYVDATIKTKLGI
jgi:hypothetical protein